MYGLVRSAFYFSWYCWGSVNHLHLQAIFYENTSDEPAVMPVERYMTDTLKRKDSVRRASLRDYPQRDRRGYQAFTGDR